MRVSGVKAVRVELHVHKVRYDDVLYRSENKVGSEYNVVSLVSYNVN